MASIGQVYYDVIPNLDGFAAKVAAGVGSSGKPLKIKVDADTAAASAGIQKLTTHTAKLSGLITKLDNPSVQRFGRGMVIAGAAIAVGIGAAVKVSADFEQAVSHVAATSKDAKTNIGQLRAEAIKYGASTAFSAKEAANAQEELIKANVSVTDTIHGGLAGALDLAAAGSLGVADAAGIMATTMSQFKVPGTEASHVADLLAAAAGKAQGEVGDFAGALKYVGPIAHSTGVSIEETVGVLAELADAGIKGEQAGTSLRSMMVSLTAPVGAGAKAIKKYGIDMRDASGNFIGMQAAAGELQTKLSGLSRAERDAALARIFGKNSITAATVLYEGGAKGVDKWTKAVDDSGFAADVAQTKMDNLKGDVEKLSGAIQSAAIDTASSSTTGLRGAVQGVTGLVDAYENIPDGAKSAAFGIAGVTAATLLAGGGLVKLAGFASSARGALVNLGVAATSASAAAGGIGIALAVATGIIGHFIIENGKAVARQNDLTTALHNSNGALDANIAQLRAKTLEESGALASAQKLGISIGDLTEASLGNESAQKRVNDKLKQQGDILHAAGGGVDEFGRSTNELEGDLVKVGKAIGSGNKELDNATAKWKREKESMESITGSAKDLTARLKGLPKSKRVEIKALIKAGDLAGAKAKLDKISNAKRLANIKTRADPGGVSKAKRDIGGIKGKPTTVKVSPTGVPPTQKKISGIRHRGVTVGVKSAGVPGTQSQIKGIKGTSVVARVVASGIGAVQGAINAIHGTAVNIIQHIIKKADGGPLTGRAGGGPIHGPGGPRDDLITGINRANGAAQYAFSNGEFIVNAAQTAANRGAVETINRGGKWDLTPRRAGGGVGAVAQSFSSGHRPLTLVVNLDLGPELGGIRRIVTEAVDENGEFTATLARMKN